MAVLPARKVISTHGMRERILIAAVRSGLLEIDEDGRIWRVAEMVERRGGETRPCERRRAEHQTGKYLQVRQHLNGERVCCMAHRLVWQHFRGDIPDGYELNHMNGDRSDNRLANLEIVNRSQNVDHAYRTGLKFSAAGEAAPSAKFSDETIAKARQMLASGARNVAVTRALGISSAHVSRIKLNRTRVSE